MRGNEEQEVGVRRTREQEGACEIWLRGKGGEGASLGKLKCAEAN